MDDELDIKYDECMGMRRITVTLTTDALRELTNRARLEGRNISDMVRMMITSYGARRPNKVKPSGK